MSHGSRLQGKIVSQVLNFVKYFYMNTIGIQGKKVSYGVEIDKWREVNGLGCGD